MTRTFSALFVQSLSCALFAACGGGEEPQPADGYRPLDASADAEPGSVVVPPSVRYCRPDQHPAEDDCTAREGTFVNAAAEPGGDGSVERPYRTIGEALAKSATVFVCAGEYTEPLRITTTARVIGGLDCAHWRWRADNVTTLTAPVNQIPLTVRSGNANVLWSDFSIVARDAEGNDGINGRSSVAVFVASSRSVTLSRLRIKAGNGTAGTRGNSGTGNRKDGAAAQASNDGWLLNCADGTMSRSGEGGGSQGGTNGVASPGYVTAPGRDGGGGAPGFSGRPGANGAAGAAAALGSGAQLTAEGLAISTSARGGNGTPGQGGGGGALSYSGSGIPPQGDDGGSGGCGGAGGGAGGSGGWSVALASYQSKIVVTSSLLATAIAGNGGAGGSGEGGGAGDDPEFPPAGRTGAGGAGGGGGGGAGGNGGHGGSSIDVIHVGDAPQIDSQQGWSFGAGASGGGGGGGGGGGASPAGGRAADGAVGLPGTAGIAGQLFAL